MIGSLVSLTLWAPPQSPWRSIHSLGRSSCERRNQGQESLFQTRSRRSLWSTALCHPEGKENQGKGCKKGWGEYAKLFTPCLVWPCWCFCLTNIECILWMVSIAMCLACEQYISINWKSAVRWLLTEVSPLNLPGARRVASCPHRADAVPEPERCSWQWW